LGLKIIPVLNKIDLPTVDLDTIKLEVMESFGFDESEIISVSAKTSQNVGLLLQAIIDKIPAPKGKINDPLRCLVMTSHYDYHKGVVASVRIVDGVLDQQKLELISTETSFNPIEVGIFSPVMKPTQKLSAGEVGYLATGLKDIKKVRVGDTVTSADLKDKVEPLAGYQEPTPMVYMELYPIDADDFRILKDSMDKLSLHDSSLQYQGTHSLALGNGLRVGFLGILHAEIIRERLKREFGLDLIATAPSVIYQVTTTNGKMIEAHSPGEMPDPSIIQSIAEPIAVAIIYSPERYLSSIIQFLKDRRGDLLDSQPIGVRTKLKFKIPLAEIIVDLHDNLKSISSGYASLEYQIAEYRPVDAVKVDILINKEVVEALSIITVRDQADYRGKRLVKKLKEVVPRQMFEIPIQAAIGGKIVARETVKAFRKDVTAKLYGGDRTRRMKLLKKQAKGKKRMKQVGSVELNQEAFLAVLEND